MGVCGQVESKESPLNVKFATNSCVHVSHPGTISKDGDESGTPSAHVTCTTVPLSHMVEPKNILDRL